jgi:MarR family transcriptional regulator for hemolysin
MENAQQPLGRTIVFTAKSIREAFESMLAAGGASIATWVVLSALNDEVEFVSQSALASHLHLEGATVTHHLDRLEAAGLVRRLVDPEDRRARRLELTPAGLELHQRLLAAVTELDAQMMAGLSAAERSALRSGLARIEANLAAGAAPGEASALPGDGRPAGPASDS